MRGLFLVSQSASLIHSYYDDQFVEHLKSLPSSNIHVSFLKYFLDFDEKIRL